MGVSQPFLDQIGASYRPIVMTSNWPPLVAMSVVTRWRSVPSSSVTHLSLMSGLAFSKKGVSFCISIMWPLLTVAMTSSVAAWAKPMPANASARPVLRKRFMMCLLSSHDRGRPSKRILSIPSRALGTPSNRFDTFLHRMGGEFPRSGNTGC